MEEQIRELRLEVDKFINSIEKLNPSREVSLCYTQLQRSKAWLGMALGELGTKTPYPDSTDPKSKNIEPQAEHFNVTIWVYPLKPQEAQPAIEETQTAHVKFFRKEIETYMLKFDAFMDKQESQKEESWFLSYLWQARMTMIEAKHWLGWELNRIRTLKEWENNDSPTSQRNPSMPL